MGTLVTETVELEAGSVLDGKDVLASQCEYLAEVGIGLVPPLGVVEEKLGDASRALTEGGEDGLRPIQVLKGHQCTPHPCLSHIILDEAM